MEPCPQSAEARAARSRARAAAARKNKLAGDMFRDNMWDPNNTVAAAECDDTEDLDYPVDEGDDPNDYYYQVRQRIQRLKAAGAKAAGRSPRASVSISLKNKTAAEKGAIVGGVGLGVAILAVGGYMLYRHYKKH